MRAEIQRDGLLADKFLTTNPDVPTIGFNLACAWPFPETWRQPYEQMAHRLEALGPEVYVYPYPFTHITLVTFISFARYTNPSRETVAALEQKVPEIERALAALFDTNSLERIKSFVLQPQPLVLSRAAAILPMTNPDGEVARLRAKVAELIQQNTALHADLVTGGFNVPGIIHSTVMRFRKPPQDLKKFLTAFDKVAAEGNFPEVEVKEVLLTSETKPYMRSGEVLERFALG